MIRKAFLSCILLLSALVDILGNIHLGPISVQGVLTILVLLGITACLVAKPSASWHGLRSFWPLSCLLLLSVILFFVHPPSLQAYQTIFLLWIFVGLMVTMSTGKRDPRELRYFERLVLLATATSATIYGASLLFDGLGTESVIGARSFGVYVLPGLALLLGPLSRLRSLKRRELIRVVGAGMISVLVLYVFMLYLPALSLRFLGDNTVGEYVSGDATLDTSGRAAFWVAALNSYFQSPVLGNGPGSANNLIEATFPGLGHPHNEYLRYLHDTGILGLSLLLIGCGQMIAICGKVYRRSIEVSSPAANFYLGTLLALIAILLTMLTDNTASYLFIMVPLGILVGMALRPVVTMAPQKVAKAGAST